MNQYDKIVQNEGVFSSKVRIQKHGEWDTTETNRTACKAFQKHGCEQAGIMSRFAMHMLNSPFRLA